MKASESKHVIPANFLEGGIPVRIRWIALVLVAVFCGALGGAILAPQPAGAISKDMVELEQNVSNLLQGQQDLRSAMDQNNATIKTLIQQSMDTVNQMNGQMSALQKSVQEVQANTGSRIDSMAQQTQGISDNLQDVQSRMGKLSQQLTDIQSSLQSIDAKVSGGGPSPSSEPGASPSNPAGPGGPGAYAPPTGQPNAGQPGSYPASNSYSNTAPGYGPPPAGASSGGNAGGMAPISADTLYHNALRDYTTGNYDLSRQEFNDYIRNFPSSDLASNSQFYLGEIFYSQDDYKDAITAYDLVITKYPLSTKQPSALLKKAQAENNLKEKTSAIRDLREVVNKYPGSDESRRAKTLLQSMGASSTATHSTAAH
jgi:tol-pal system protein YbgF